MDMNGLRPHFAAGSNGKLPTPIQKEIEVLKKHIESEPTDWMSKLHLAEMLHRQGQVEEARVLYQDIIMADPGSIYGQHSSADHGSWTQSILYRNAENSSHSVAGSDLPRSKPLGLPTTEKPAENYEVFNPAHLISLSSRKPKLIRSFPGKFRNWLNTQSIRRKQLIVFFLLEGITLSSLIALNGWLMFWHWDQDTHDSVRSELAMTELIYQNKINQMLLSLQGQANNPVMINAAKGSRNAEIRAQVQTALVNETQALDIEYATLVGKDFKIIANANANRQTEIFNPNQIVSRVLQTFQPLQTTEIVRWSEIQRESPSLPADFKNQDALMRYVATPVKDPVTQELIGVLLGGEIINYKQSLFEPIDHPAFLAGFSAIFLTKNQQEFQLVNLHRQPNTENLWEEAQFKTALLSEAVAAKGQTVITRQKLGSSHYQVAAKLILNRLGEPVAVMVRGIPTTFKTSMLMPYLGVQFILSAGLLLLSGALAWWVSKLITQPIDQLQASLQQASGGELIAVPAIHQDEMAQLSVNLQDWIHLTTTKIQALEAQVSRSREEARFHAREKEGLQQGMNQLLRDIEAIQRGELMVQVPVSSLHHDEAGASTALHELATVINTTVESLQELVKNVQEASCRLHQSACDTTTSVQTLATEANNQSLAIAAALASVADMGRSMQSIASATLKAAVASRQGLVAFKDGNKIMNQTVQSIEQVRNSVTAASVKVQRLADSSQEISKILQLISGISEKTNLVAFNASIVAARAGDNGKVFRVVADEVQRLAERVSESTQEIEQLVTTIQQDTTQVLETMETSSFQVEAGTAMMIKTQQMLRKLAAISHNINQLLQSISTSTVSQAQSSQRVNQTMQSAAAIAQVTSAESESVAKTLQELVAVAEQLQNSVSRFHK